MLMFLVFLVPLRHGAFFKFSKIGFFAIKLVYCRSARGQYWCTQSWSCFQNGHGRWLTSEFGLYAMHNMHTWSSKLNWPISRYCWKCRQIQRRIQLRIHTQSKSCFQRGTVGSWPQAWALCNALYVYLINMNWPPSKNCWPTFGNCVWHFSH